MYKTIIRPILFRLSAEKAHQFSFSALQSLQKIGLLKVLFPTENSAESPFLQQKLWGLNFPNPIGLAAGFDKNALLLNEWENFGFGFIEIGTITPLAQAGNPRPRLFRLVQDRAIINRMGFNNEGMEKVVERLKNRKTSIIIGGNIGKNKITPNENAVDDYQKTFQSLYPFVDYFVVNVSSPNTPNLRQLQAKEPLLALLQTLQHQNQGFAQPKPILLKIAPDLSQEQLDDVLEVVQKADIQGIVATNTTIARTNLKTSSEKLASIGEGGLSGQPLREKSTEIIRYLHTQSQGKIPIIGVGGIASASQAIEKLEAGASLLQLYTGFVYEGPALIKDIHRGISEYYRKKQAQNITPITLL